MKILKAKDRIIPLVALSSGFWSSHFLWISLFDLWYHHEVHFRAFSGWHWQYIISGLPSTGPLKPCLYLVLPYYVHTALYRTFYAAAAFWSSVCSSLINWFRDCKLYFWYINIFTFQQRAHLGHGSAQVRAHHPLATSLASQRVYVVPLERFKLGSNFHWRPVYCFRVPDLILPQSPFFQVPLHP
jgi:hypothetical protein